jgi:hypothetical protein
MDSHNILNPYNHYLELHKNKLKVRRTSQQPELY